jgi:hypothetical protein
MTHWATEFHRFIVPIGMEPTEIGSEALATF